MHASNSEGKTINVKDEVNAETSLNLNLILIINYFCMEFGHV